MTFVSRILGLVRDVVLARVFGPGDGADAFFLAFKIPNFLRRLFAEGAFNQAFVPVLSEYRSTRSLAQVQVLINAVAGYLGTVLLLITAVVVLAAPWISIPIAYGFTADPAKFALFVDMLRITFPYLLLISLTAFAGSILNSYDRFAIPALTPALLNLFLIASALLLSPYFLQPEIALAWGVLMAGIAQLLFQLPFLVRLQLMPRPRLVKQHEGVRRIIKLMIPALFGVSVSQINLLLDTVLASLLQDGSVGWLYYSDRLSELPLGVIGIAIATVLLPKLSHSAARADDQAFHKTLGWAIRVVLLVGLPAMAALLVLAGPLLTTLFQYQAFTVFDVQQSSGSLMAYALGLPAFMLIKILAPAFFSRQNTRTPVKIGIWAMALNMVFNLILIVPLAHVGLALATSLSAWINAGLLAFTLHRQGDLPGIELWRSSALRSLLASLAMAAVLWLLLGWPLLDYPDALLGRAWRTGFLVVSGLVSYSLFWLALGGRLREVRY
jgi:putative peptidoglycan lipid II flippase